jgi:hypothetical protein
VLLNKEGETNLYHLRHFLLFTSQNALLNQLCLMSSKHPNIVVLGEKSLQPLFDTNIL